MSPVFKLEFRKKNPCHRCGRVSKTSLCREHLDIAKLAFRAWYNERKLQGKCAHCDKPAARVGIEKRFGGRCSKHREENRQKCARWMLAHPGYKSPAERRQRAILASGRCPKCPEHNPVVPGGTRCQACRDRKYGSEKKAPSFVAELAQRNLVRSVATLMDARAQLAARGLKAVGGIRAVPV